MPVNQLLDAIQKLATRPRDVRISGHAHWLETIAMGIREIATKEMEFNRAWLLGVCDKMEVIAQDLMNMD